MKFSYKDLLLKIPLGLIYLRLSLGFIMLISVFSANSYNVIFYATLVIMGLLSDIFDGIIARKLGIDNHKMRKLDTLVDRIFWAIVFLSCWKMYPVFMASMKEELLVLIIAESIVFITTIKKFNKIPAPHNYLSKLWGLIIFLLIMEIILTGKSSWLFDLMILIGLISRVDSLLIYQILPEWKRDVPSSLHAYQLSKALKGK